MEFNFLRLVFTLTLEADIADPYFLFGIKGNFAEVFRKAAGCERPQCAGCGKGSECPYRLIFSQAMLADPSAIKRFQKPPLPFAFGLPLLPPPPNRGDSCEIVLTLAGFAVNHVIHFQNAVRSMFAGPALPWDGFFTLEKIESVDYFGKRSLISRHEAEAAADRYLVLSLDGLEKTTVLPAEEINLAFITPLRIIKDGRPLRELTFSALVMPLLRRMSAIAFYYCYLDLDLDYKWLSSQSREISNKDVELKWVEWGQNLGGIIGNVTFRGTLAEFHRILQFGEYLHVGKGATYGLGRYRLE